MADAKDLIEKARSLGEALAAHPTVRAHHQAQRDVQNDPAAQELVRQYQEQAATIQHREAQGKPIEVADKQKLKGTEALMAGNEAMKTLMRTQVEYVGIMNQVNQAIEAPLAKLSEPEPDA